MMATRRPVAFSAARMRAMRSAWPVKSPCEKLSRATLSPARMRRSSISGDSEAGPMVATILVLWFGSISHSEAIPIGIFMFTSGTEPSTNGSPVGQSGEIGYGCARDIGQCFARQERLVRGDEHVVDIPSCGSRGFKRAFTVAGRLRTIERTASTGESVMRPKPTSSCAKTPCFIINRARYLSGVRAMGRNRVRRRPDGRRAVRSRTCRPCSSVTARRVPIRPAAMGGGRVVRACLWLSW